MAHIKIRGEHNRIVVEVDGHKLRGVRSIRFGASVDDIAEVSAELIATTVDFDVHGRFVPLLNLVDADAFERQATRELYERLKERFEGHGHSE